jgi:hypothetical protein
MRNGEILGLLEAGSTGRDGTVNLRQRCVREQRRLGFSSSQSAAEVLETSRQTAKARSRVARRCSAVAFSWIRNVKEIRDLIVNR